MRVKSKMLVATFLLLVGLCAGGVLAAHLFRTEKHDNPHLGLIEYKYRWGHAHEIAADSNRDGSIDYRGRFDGSTGSFGTHDSPIEYWEDRDFDGVFEIHVMLDGPVIRRMELDEDADGEYERVLTGDEAAGFYSIHR